MQTSYSNTPGVAFAGLIADTNYQDIVSKLCATRQLEQVVVTTAANEEVFTITINGNAYAYTSDGTATKAEISAGLKALIDAGSEGVTVTDDLADTLLIESDSYDEGFTITVTNPLTGVLTLTSLVDQEDAIPFGSVVVEDERVSADPLTGARQGIRLPRTATDVTTLGRTQGVAVADTSKVATAEGYVAGEAVPVLKKGRIWMAVEDVASVALGGLVYVRVAATGTQKLGAIRAADDGANTDVLPYASAHFTGQKNTALGLAVVEWNV
jgi:hypothetical protein